MRTHRHQPCPSPICLAIAALLLNVAVTAESRAQSTEPTLPELTIKASRQRESKASIGGLGDAPEWQQPQQAQRVGEQALKNAQVQRLGDVVKLDASVSASYNAAGYWDYLSVRGFVLDLAQNYRREGLPISGETHLPLDNKAGIEILKGTSGMQAGTSSPGGLMNLLVKRPDERVRQAEFAFTGHRGVLASADISERFGPAQDVGLRVNVAHERLHSAWQHSQGQRQLLALAGDWRMNPDTLVEAEIEHSRRSQRSAPGFSLLGTTLPLASSINPNINLNNQPWAQAVVMRGVTGTLRLTQKLPQDWKITGTLGEQRLKTDDRMAFPFGGLCVDPLYENCDRFSASGEFAVYDFRSDGELRVTRALDVNASSQARTGAVSHQFAVGVLRTLARVDMPMSAYNVLSDPGNISGDFSVAPDATLSWAQIERHQRSTEFYARDSMRITDAWRAWAGVRHTQMSRKQYLSDLTQATTRQDSFTTPWLAVGYEFKPMHQIYASWGEGVEVPAPKFTQIYNYENRGETLAAMKSRQWELGVKGLSGQTNWSLNYFRTVRPEAATVQTGTDGGGFPLYSYMLDGDSLHQGIEGQLRTRIDAYSLALSALWIDAERRSTHRPEISGKKPVNVPDYTLKMSHGYRISALPGLSLQGDIVHEGPRTADATNNIRIPAWTRIDIGVGYAQALGQSRAITLRAGVTNLLDTRAWIESPTQFDHIYLFPMAERSLTASMQISF